MFNPRPPLSDLPGLLAHFSAKYESFDAALFTAIFTCLVAGERNLILRTYEEDITKVTIAAVNILVTVFGLPTQRVQARSKVRDPSLFLRSLFLVSPSATPSEPARPSLNTRRPSNTKHSTRKSKSSSTTRNYQEDPQSSGSSSSPPTHPSFVLPPRPLRNLHLLQPSQSDGDASTRTLRPQSRHGFPIPAPPHTPESIITELPRNLSVGGISVESHTRLRSPTLRNNSLWRVPRLPHALVLSRLERAPFATQCALSEVIRTRRIVLPDDSDSDDEVRPSQAGSDAEQAGEGKKSPFKGGTAWNLPAGFFVIYVCDLGNGQERPSIPSFLLDSFAFNARIMLDPSALSSPPWPLRISTPQISLDELDGLRALAAQQTHISIHLQRYIANLLTAARHHPSLRGSLISARCIGDMDDFVRASRVVFGPSFTPSRTPVGEEKPQTLDCSERDAARVMAGVLGHRLSVRRHIDGLLGSMVRTAVTVDGQPEPRDAPPRETVNSTLAQILSQV